MKALVLKVEQRRISLSIKPSHFDEADFNDEGGNVSNDEQGIDQLGVVGGHDDSDAASEPDEDDDKDSDAVDEDHSESDDDAIDINTGNVQQLLGTVPAQQDDKAPDSSTAPMKITGFQWFGDSQNAEDADSESSDESDKDEQPSKKKRKKRKEIEYDLTADMHSKAPESNADFERLLLGSPNSSYLWIQYMSFQLQLSEVDKAREIARRAVETINFREEQERLNVWIALLNLENVYGTDESLDEIFKEAARANDSKTIHLRLASIFEESRKLEVRQSVYR